MRVLPPRIGIDIILDAENGDSNDPFAQDLMNRKPLADSLMQFFANVEDPIVLALDGPWGIGKSTFALMLSEYLKQSKIEPKPFVTGYIDAFAMDYVDDPFVPIAMRISEIVQENKAWAEHAEDYTKKAISFFSKAFVGLAGLGINIATAGMAAPLIKDLGEKGVEGLGEQLGKLTEDIVGRRMKEFASEEKGMEDFRQALESLAGKVKETTGKPLVIFIDELDRCRPSFAVSFIERVKHFFSVPNVIFVLVMNREQVESSLKACYGSELDAHTYLQKFVSFWVTMPPIGKEPMQQNGYSAFIPKLIDHFGFANQWKESNWKFLQEMCIDLAVENGLTLRQIEQWMVNLAIGRASFSNDQAGWMEILLVIVALTKAIRPDFYHNWVIIGRQPNSHSTNHDETNFLFRLKKWALGGSVNIFGERNGSLSQTGYPFGEWKDIVPKLQQAFELFGNPLHSPQP